MGIYFVRTHFEFARLKVFVKGQIYCIQILLQFLNSQFSCLLTEAGWRVTEQRSARYLTLFLLPENQV